MTTIISGNTAATSFVVSGDTTGNLVLDAKSGVINANTTTGGLILPTGTSGQRPTAANGMIRYSSSSNAFEMYANGAWAAANVSPVPVNTVAPVVSGAAANGALLSCTTGTWNNSPNTYFYQWSANSVAISGSTSSTLTLGASQVNANITCSVTAQNAAGNSIPAVSNSIGPIANSYLLTKSLRFRSSASAYLNRTPASAGNRRTWTWSGWVKRGALGSYQRMFEARSSTGDSFIFNDNDTLNFWLNDASSANLTTTQVFRDPSAWYHLVLAVDTTQATASNRIKIYVNGTQITAFSSATYPSQNYDCHVNNTVVHNIGRHISSAIQYFDGYMAEINFIDGQALTPSSFGITDTNTGVWQPIKYSGTYGTNGFYLNFSDNSNNTATTIGKDYSGNGNNWTPNNISVTSGATYDSMTDVPTNTSATAANYCVWFPQQGGQTWTYSNGNLQAQNGNGGSNAYSNIGTISVSTGKYYWEVQSLAAGPTSLRVPGVGIIDPTRNILDAASSVRPDVYLSGNGTIDNSSGSALQSGFSNMAANDIVGVAVDADAKTVQFYRNGLAVGTAQSYTASSVAPSVFSYSGYGFIANFGQRPFTYTPPTGFLALNTSNLPNPTTGTSSATRANQYFDTGLYTGTGSAAALAVSGPPTPDFVWIKRRSVAAGSHALYDVIRGFQYRLYSNTTDGEFNYGSTMLSPTATGFNLTTADNDHNTSGSTYVAWQWKAAAANTINTSGTITSTVRASTTAGFSIVTYTGTGANATVGHGLGVAPSFIIVRSRNNGGATNWAVWHTSFSSTEYIFLNSTAAKSSSGGAALWNSTLPSSTVFSIGTDTNTNYNTTNMLAYCFAQVAGYSAFGSYTGNGSSDGPFVYTGFRPKLIMIKRSDSTGNWVIQDSSRSLYNVSQANLYANLSNVEDIVTTNCDFLSNGFKFRGTENNTNASGGTYIYMAFAENPYKFANAR